MLPPSTAFPLLIERDFKEEDTGFREQKGTLKDRLHEKCFSEHAVGSQWPQVSQSTAVHIIGKMKVYLNS